MFGRIAKVFLFCIAVSLLTAAFVAAQAPNTISYQGRLTDEVGQPIRTSTSVVFAVYSVPSGGTAMYSTTKNITPDTNGIFTVELGPFGSTVFNGSKRYLGIKVGADAEMTPRQLLTSAPYSFNANSVANEVGLTFHEAPMAYVSPLPATIKSIDSISISVPAAGYVYVFAHGMAYIGHLSGTTDEVRFDVEAIRDNISLVNFGVAYISIPSAVPSSSYWYIPFEAHRVFPVNAAGTYKYFINSETASGGGNDQYFGLQMTAFYVPSAYGAVDKTYGVPDGANNPAPAGAGE